MPLQEAMQSTGIVQRAHTESSSSRMTGESSSVKASFGTVPRFDSAGAVGLALKEGQGRASIGEGGRAAGGLHQPSAALAPAGWAGAAADVHVGELRPIRRRGHHHRREMKGMKHGET